MRKQILEVLDVEVSAGGVRELGLEDGLDTLVKGKFGVHDLDLAIAHLAPDAVGRDEPAEVSEIIIDQSRNTLENRSRPSGP